MRDAPLRFWHHWLDRITSQLSGNHNPESLAQLADGRCKRSKEDIALSLEGTWDADHLFELKQAYELYKYLQTQVTECDHKIEEMLKSYAVVVDTEMSGYVESKKTVCRKNAVAFDVEKYGYAIWGINPMTIPGMSVCSVLQLIGELGHNFVLKFDTPEKFCKWCNIVPNNKISGGKLLSSRVPKRKSPVGQIFRLCANALKDAKNPMGYYFRRIKSRGGHMQAIVATAHKMARIFYVMVRNKCAYDETKVGLDEKELLTMKIQRTQRALDRLNAKISAAAC
jgi:hypothetical protein